MATTKGRRRAPPTPARENFDQTDDSVVVVIGSGAGGGTVAHDLTKAGVRVVLLEAGSYFTIDDWVNNEWEAFGQMAWLDMRTTSGSWRIVNDFPNLPAWIVKAVGGSTTHWAGATPRFYDHEWKTRTYYGQIDGANLLDWPVDGDEMRAVLRHGRGPNRLHPHQRPRATAGEQQLLRVRQRRREARLPLLRHRSVRHERRAVRRPAGLDPGRLQLPGRQERLQVEHPGQRDPQGAGHRQARPAAELGTRCRSPTTPPAAPTRCCTWTPTATCSGSRPGSSAWPATRSKPRGCCCSRPARSSPTAWPTPPASWAETTCGTPRVRCTRSSSGRCACTAARRWPA